MLSDKTPAESSSPCDARPSGPFRLTRRSFFGIAGAGGVTVLFHQLAQALPPQDPAPAPPVGSTLGHAPVPPGLEWSGGPGKARYRIEGLAKVTGEKIYARDFRAADMPDWPRTERVAMILRADNARRVFAGLDLSMLTPDLQPLHVIVQKRLLAPLANQVPLDSLGLTLPSSSKGPDGAQRLLVRQGDRAQFYGQAVAILVFADYGQFRRAKRLLQFNPQVVQYGPEAEFKVKGPYQPVNYLTRYAGPDAEPFSQVQVGFASDPHQPDSPSQPYNSRAKALRERIDAELQREDLLQLGGTYRTQVLDPMFMEPEAGLAWLDRRGGGTLNLVLGTQATNGDWSDTLALFSKSKEVQVGQVALHSCFPGGGFGGRDTSTFPPLLAVTAAVTDGPVRVAQDRYEQFQSGLKQLSSEIDHHIAVDRRSGRFVAFRSRQTLGAGGNNNYSQYVAMLAGYCGLSGYHIEKAYVDAQALPSLGVVAGSMRGFGGPQASFAVETLVDEVAVALQRDPIRLREDNALQRLDRTITGAPLAQPMTLVEICRRARAHPLWTGRERVRREKARRGVRYGVGFALANQAYGTGTDGVMASVNVGPGGRLTVCSNCVDMGNGSATTLALRTAGFAGQNASEVVMGDVRAFDGLGLNSRKGGSWSDPRWTAAFSMSSSACITAFQQVHVVEQAARVLFETGLLPAAASLWQLPLAPEALTALRERAQWRDGVLRAPGLAPLPLERIAARLHALRLPAGAMVHAVYQAAWVSADYTLGFDRTLPLPLDGVSLQPAGSAEWQPVTRRNLVPPRPGTQLYGRSLYAPSGVLAAVEIDAQDQPRVVALEMWLDASKVLQPDLLIGQAQGGIAMGIGYALLEELPLEAGGAGDGRWNLDRYHVPLAADVPLDALHVHVLPSSEDSAKGIAEAVLCPVAPAIGNAIAHATRYRFRPRRLPVTAAEIMKGMKA